MRVFSRDAWLALILLVLLVVITLAAGFSSADKPEVLPYTTASTAPDGVNALWQWLQANGYPITNESPSVFSIAPKVGTILLLEPSEIVADSEWQIIDDWIEAGGSLIAAGEGVPAAITMEHFDVSMFRELAPSTVLLTLQTPLMIYPPVTEAVHPHQQAFLEIHRSDTVTHLASASGPVMISLRRGDGLVILSAAPFPFSNAGLKEPANPDLVLNTIAVGSGIIWFDEWHHGIHGSAADEIVGPIQWLGRAPAGRALLYTAAVIFLGLALAGWRFGRPVIPVQDRARRAPLEYISAIANLSRRAGHRQSVLNRYHHQLKSELGKRYRLSPALPDDEFVAQLATYNPQMDMDALGRLLSRLQQRNMTESEMVQLAAEVARILSTRTT
jgi:hypothetical protein